jgi:Zn-dependent protease with chaperone function
MVSLALLQGVLITFVIFLARIIGNVVDRALCKDGREYLVAGSGLMCLFMSHPPLDERIAALQSGPA